ERGFETIRTCGLDRETLRVARQGAAQDAHDECRLLLKNQHDLDALKRLVKFGTPERAFAGVVRAIAHELLGVPWHKLEARANVCRCGPALSIGPRLSIDGTR